MKRVICTAVLVSLGFQVHATEVPPAKGLPIADGIVAGVLLKIPDSKRSAVRYSPEVFEIERQAKEELKSIEQRGKVGDSAQRNAAMKQQQSLRSSRGSGPLDHALDMLFHKTASETTQKIKANGGWAIWLTEGTPVVYHHNSTINGSPTSYVTYSSVFDGLGGYKNDHAQSFRSVANPFDNVLIRSSDTEYGVASTVVKYLHLNGTDLFSLSAKREAIGFNIARPEQLGDLSNYRLGFKGRLIESVPGSPSTRITRIEDKSIVLVDLKGNVITEVDLDDPNSKPHVVWMHSGNAIQLCEPISGARGELVESSGKITMPVAAAAVKGKPENYTKSAFPGKTIDAQALIDTVDAAAKNLNCIF